MLSKVKSAACLALAAALLILSACSGGEAAESTPAPASGGAPASQAEEKKPATVSWITTQAKHKEVRKTIAEAIKADENITIDFQVVPDAQYDNLLKMKISSNELPDIVDLLVNSQIASFGGAETYEDLSNEPWVSRLVAPDNIKYTDGKIYASPQFAIGNMQAVWYNKKVFEELQLKEPTTWEEFLGLCEKIKNSGKDITPFYIGGKDLWAVNVFFAHTFGMGLHPDELATYAKLMKNEVQWKDLPAFKKAIEDYTLLFDKGYVNKDFNTATFDMAKIALAEGRAAMYMCIDTVPTDIATKYPDAEIGGFPLPYNGKQLAASSKGVQGLLVPKSGSNKENAKRLLDLYTQPKYLNMFFAENPGIPAYKDVDGGKLHEALDNIYNNYVKQGKNIEIFQPNTMAASSLTGNDLPNLFLACGLKAKTPQQAVDEFNSVFMEFMKQKQAPGF